jgi:hypothetical protein
VIQEQTMFKSILIFLFFLFPIFTEEYEFPLATKEAREKYKAGMLNTISSEINSFKQKNKESSIKKTFEYMQVLNYIEDDGYSFLKSTLIDYPIKSENFYSSCLETIYTLYESGFEEEMQKILQETTSAKHFTIASHFLLRLYPEEKEKYLTILKKRFKDYQKIPQLRILAQYLEISPSEFLLKRPSLKDLFSHTYEKDKFILFSIQRANRDYPGLLIIKKPDGTFLRREDGSIFTISQLARSVSDLPSYVVNGNTPQGIFSIQKIQTVKNDIIGPTPAVITSMPFEISTELYFHSPKKLGKWSLKSYLDILPYSWRNYFPIHEAYIAGEMGRSGIYAHGTTVDTEFYKDYSYYPNTPTRGCLSSKEIWSRKTGKSLFSDQSVLVNALKSLEPSRGYLIVFDIDDREMPVTLDEVLMDILEVEDK